MKIEEGIMIDVADLSDEQIEVMMDDSINKREYCDKHGIPYEVLRNWNMPDNMEWWEVKDED